MKMKFGAIVVDGRNKIGGHVASKNRAGSYLRTKVTPVNPQSSYQLTARTALTSFSQGWRGLTQAARDAWNAAVADYQRTDIFGDLRSPTGLNLYVRLNRELGLIGQSSISTPPLPASVGAVAATSLAAAAGAGTISLTLDGAVPSNTSIKIYATPAVSPGKSFVKSQYRFIGYKAAATATPVDIQTEYDARFGAVGTAGQKIFVKIVPVNETTGQVGQASQVSAVIGA